MKFLKIILLFSIVIFVSAYVILFTPPGNKIVKPYVEKRLKKNLQSEIVLTSFSLKPSVFKVAGGLSSASFIIDGKYKIFDMSGSGVYKLDIKDFAEIKRLFNLKTDIQGDYFGTGGFSGNKKRLIIDGKGKFAGIDIDYKTGFNDCVPASLNVGIYNADFKKLLNVIGKRNYYIFDSLLNADINYDPQTEKGDFTIDFENLTFLYNRLSAVILKFTNIDITKQAYKKARITGNINKNIITANLDMKGEVNITAQEAVLDLKNNTINAPLDINIKDKSLIVTVKGKTDNPEVKADVSEYIKKEIKKRLGKYIDTEKDTVNKLLKKIF